MICNYSLNDIKDIVDSLFLNKVTVHSRTTLMSQLHSVTYHISHTHLYFVHNLYTKNKTAENRSLNLHPCWQYAGTQNKKEKSWRITSPLKPPHIPEVQKHTLLYPGTSQIAHNLPLVCSIQRRDSLQL